MCRTPTGEEGTCRHVIYCRMPELKDDIWRMLSQLCVIEKRLNKQNVVQKDYWKIFQLFFVCVAVQ